MDTHAELKGYWDKASTLKKVVLGGAALFGAYQTYKALFPHLKNFHGDVAVITGAGSGIGRLLALSLAREGCSVVLWDIDEAKVAEVADEIRKLPIEVAPFKEQTRYYALDITDRKKVYEVAKEVVAELGRVDILINNAGIVSGEKIFDKSDEKIVKTIDVNATSHFWTIKSFVPGMITRNHGHIVTIASAAGLTGVAGLVDYCASKYAAVGTAESLRQEIRKLGKTGIQSLTVCPYYINTGMFEGVKTYNNFLLPILDPHYVVKQIVYAMKKGEVLLCLPKFVGIARAITPLTSVKHADSFIDYLGTNKTMDEFKQTRNTWNPKSTA